LYYQLKFFSTFLQDNWDEEYDKINSVSRQHLHAPKKKSRKKVMAEMQVCLLQITQRIV